MINDPSIKKLFEEYEKAFDALDFKMQAHFFADTFIMAGPKGAISRSKTEFLKNASQAADFYKSIGQTSAKIISIEEALIDNQYSMVKIHWGVTFKKTGDKPIEFDISYIVHKAPNAPEIILAISHEDEEKAMKDLGLLIKTNLPVKSDDAKITNMKNIKFTNLAVFIILFGIALIEAFQKQNWLEAFVFLILGAISLRADIQKN